MKGEWYNLRWTASLEHAKKFGLTALKHLNKTSFTASTWKAIPRVPFPRERAKSDDNEFSLTFFAQSMSKAKSGLNHLETLCNLDRATQFTIVPSHHRVWVDGAMTMARWFDDDDAMVWQCDGDGAMTRLRWCDRIMTMKRCSIAPSASHHRYRVIAPSRYRLFCVVSKKKKWPQMWFFYSRNINFPCFLL